MNMCGHKLSDLALEKKLGFVLLVDYSCLEAFEFILNLLGSV